ncbi:transcriptional regulator, IclR family, C-terminal domain protein [Bordetella bronchiseptica MO211]|nr:transcriptional regulator, IclR family, C-terminal domain protein [Bordetella bronchiseptica MO211]
MMKKKPIAGTNETTQPLTKAAAPARKPAPRRTAAGPQNHRTVDRVTQILEEVVYRPGMTFADLVRALGAAKSSVHGFIRGLLAKGWLYEDDHRFYLGPAVYGLTLASGHIRAGSVTHEDLMALHEETGLAVFLGVQAGDHLIYIAEAGSDPVAGFEARSNIRRTLLSTAGGKALLAAKSPSERESYLRRRPQEEGGMVDAFLAELDSISRTSIATNLNPARMRFGLATVVRSRSGDVVATVTLVGPAAEIQPRLPKLSNVLVKHADAWARRSAKPREVI